MAQAIIDAPSALGGLAGRLDGRQEEADQDGDDGDDDEQLDEREAACLTMDTHGSPSCGSRSARTVGPGPVGLGFQLELRFSLDSRTPGIRV
jgi:hypothetical protein